MTGYTRQSIAEIAIDEEVKAEPLNAEFNALADAFNSSSGHAHDGTSGSGPKINLSVSVTGTLPIVHVADNSITKAKIEQVSSKKVLGNMTGSTANISEVAVLDEDNMVSNSDTSIPTQQSVKAYVDALDGAVVDAIEVVTDAIDAELADVYDYVDAEIIEVKDYVDNRPAFKAHKNGSNQLFAASTPAKITFTTEEFDRGSYYDPTNSQYVPPTGIYRLSAAYAKKDAGSGVPAIEIRKNGAAVARGYSLTEGSITGGASVTVLVQANGTDYFEVYLVPNVDISISNTTVLGLAINTYFCGEQI